MPVFDYQKFVHHSPPRFDAGVLQGLLRKAHPPREPEAGEREFFAANPNVAGYAADDDRVVLSPSIPTAWKPSVWANEAARIEMRRRGDQFAFPIEPHQQQFFSGGPYADNHDAARQTIVARIVSGDQGAGPYSREQHAAAAKFAERYGVR